MQINNEEKKCVRVERKRMSGECLRKTEIKMNERKEGRKKLECTEIESEVTRKRSVESEERCYTAM